MVGHHRTCRPQLPPIPLQGTSLKATTHACTRCGAPPTPSPSPPKCSLATIAIHGCGSQQRLKQSDHIAVRRLGLPEMASARQAGGPVAIGPAGIAGNLKCREARAAAHFLSAASKQCEPLLFPPRKARTARAAPGTQKISHDARRLDPRVLISLAPAAPSLSAPPQKLLGPKARLPACMRPPPPWHEWTAHTIP